MRKKQRNRQLHKLLLVLLAVLFALLPATEAYADTTFSRDGGDPTNKDVIYIAGNPSFYPYEYYDPLTGTYKGVFPELYQAIYEKTGLQFEYIDTGTGDVRLLDAKTASTDIVSAYVYDEKEANSYRLKDAIPVVEYQKADGTTVQICIIFSHYATSTKVEAVKAGMEAVPDGTVPSLIAETLQDSASSHYIILYVLAIILLAGIFLMISGRAAYLYSLYRQDERSKDAMEYTDNLTQVGNLNYLVREFAKLGENKYKAMYLMAHVGFDIGRVNKQYGEEMAENQLYYAATLLKTGNQDHDVIARVSGGAFAILHVCGTAAEAEDWAEQLMDRLNTYCVQFGKNYAPKFRCGVYRIPADRWNLTLALKNASRCYDIAFQKDVDCFVYSAEMERQDVRNEILSHEAAEAVSGSQIRQYYQPLIDSHTGRIVGAEGLARWEHPKLGLLMPYRFIQMMIDENKITDLDMRMFEESCKRMAKWHREGKRYFLSTNFTRASLTSPDFILRIRTISGRYLFNRKSLVIEITEDSLEGKKEVAYENMQALKNLGFSVALDDLGSGYTFFSDLVNYPLDAIKVDRGMMLDAEKDEKSAQLMRGIIRMCRQLGMMVICEGIENRQQDQLVRTMGCNFIQGFYYYKALSPEEAEKIM